VTEPRVSASIEVAGLIRRVEADGDHAAVLRRGDKERGSLLIVIRSRGRYVISLERSLGPSGRYGWVATGPADSESEEKLAEFLQKRATFDQDLWIVELDIAQPERFVAETTGGA
jgi:hypothetical protein